MSSDSKQNRRPKLTLKLFLLFVTAVAVLFGLSTQQYFQMRAEESYLNHLKNRLGEVNAPIGDTRHLKSAESENYLDQMLWVKFDYQYDKQGVFQNDVVPPGPEWLRRHVGDNIFARVQTLSISTDEFDSYHEYVSYRRIDTDALNGIEKLAQLQKLSISVENVPSLANLESLPKLEELDLRTGKSFPVDLTDLSKLPSLKRARVEGPTIVTNESQVRRSKIEFLELKENHLITDLTCVRFAENLVELKIDNCIELRSLKGIENLKALEKLSLSRCQSLKSLDGIQSIAHLQVLSLHEVPIVGEVDYEHLPASVEQLKVVD